MAMKRECLCVYTHDYPGKDDNKNKKKESVDNKEKKSGEQSIDFLKFVKHSWWKILAIALLLYVIVSGFLLPVPDMPVIKESIRNIYFHVGMWFAMIFILFVGMLNSIMFLRTGKKKYDQKSLAMVYTGLLFGLLGLLTGMIWANNTWGTFWLNDPKLNGAAIGMLAYLAYLVLRSSIEDEEKRERLAAVYSIFAFVMFFVFIMIIPRLAASSIHPGVDGNPALATGDLHPSMRMVFWPAVMAWVLFSFWIAEVFFKLLNIRSRIRGLNIE